LFIITHFGPHHGYNLVHSWSDEEIQQWRTVFPDIDVLKQAKKTGDSHSSSKPRLTGKKRKHE
jgi:hypothetical protein